MEALRAGSRSRLQLRPVADLNPSQARLEREFNLALITTAPTVVYRCLKTNGEEVECSNPTDLPPANVRAAVLEPYVRMEVITPKDYVGMLMELCQYRRGVRRVGGVVGRGEGQGTVEQAGAGRPVGVSGRRALRCNFSLLRHL